VFNGVTVLFLVALIAFSSLPDDERLQASFEKYWKNRQQTRKTFLSSLWENVESKGFAWIFQKFITIEDLYFFKVAIGTKPNCTPSDNEICSGPVAVGAFNRWFVLLPLAEMFNTTNKVKV